jgi:hypothetical protein
MPRWLQRLASLFKAKQKPVVRAQSADVLDDKIESIPEKLREIELITARQLGAEVLVPVRSGNYLLNAMREARKRGDWERYASLLESHAQELLRGGFAHRAVRAFGIALTVQRDRLGGRGAGRLVLEHLAALIETEPIVTLRQAAQPLFQYLDNTLALLYRGRIEARLGSLPKAADYYSEYLDVLQPEGVDSARWFGMMELASVLLLQGELEKATQLARSALEVAERALVASNANERSSLRKCVADSAGLFLEIAAVRDDASPTEALQIAEHARALAFLDDARVLVTEQPDNLPEDYRRSESSLLQLLRMSRWYLRTAAPHERAVYEKSDDMLRSEFVDLLNSLPSEWQWYAQTRKGRPPRIDISLSRLQQQEPDTRVIAFHWGKNAVLRWQCGPDGIEGFGRLPATSAELAEKCNAFRRACSGPNEDPNVLADELGSLLLPDLSSLSHGATVCIIPSGPLWGTPFHCLKQKNAILASEFSFVVLPAISAAAFWPSKRFDHRIGFATVIGDSLNNLRFAREEAETVAQLLGAPPILGHDVIRFLTEPALEKSEILHAACHAYFDEEIPEQSGIALGDGTIMSARDISVAAVRCKLCVLSCCDTARRSGANPNDPYGVGIAFLRSGVTSVIDALWELDDESSSRFMSEFYSSILAGNSVAQGMKDARAKLIGSSGFKHPYYWGAYELAGMWNVGFRR